VGEGSTLGDSSGETNAARCAHPAKHITVTPNAKQQYKPAELLIALSVLTTLPTLARKENYNITRPHATPSPFHCLAHLDSSGGRDVGS
jgi:hypothetical protein